jgi:hypothetical protein
MFMITKAVESALWLNPITKCKAKEIIYLYWIFHAPNFLNISDFKISFRMILILLMFKFNNGTLSLIFVYFPTFSSTAFFR